MQTQTDSLGNIIVGPATLQSGRGDWLYDSVGNDLIISGGGTGNDVLIGGADADTLTGGAGNGYANSKLRTTTRRVTPSLTRPALPLAA